MLKGERDHQLLSERPSCKLNALSPTPPPYVLVVPPPARTRPSVRPLFLNQQEYPVSAPTNEVHYHGASSPMPHPITPPADREAFVCLLTLFPPFIPIPVPLSTDAAATTSPSTPTRSSSRSRGANSMTYCRHCSRGLTKKAKFSHNVPSATKDQNGMLGLTDKSTLRPLSKKIPALSSFARVLRSKSKALGLRQASADLKQVQRCVHFRGDRHSERNMFIVDDSDVFFALQTRSTLPAALLG